MECQATSLSHKRIRACVVASTSFHSSLVPRPNSATLHLAELGLGTRLLAQCMRHNYITENGGDGIICTQLRSTITVPSYIGSEAR